ncbi:MAG: FtsX-like permease family protein [Huintestinicola sp.]
MKNAENNKTNSFGKTAASIAYRYLKQQKKHTIMTIIAIILATAFMTVILTAVAVYNETDLNICRVKNGTYHVLFSDLSKEDMVTIRSMDIFSNTETYGASVYTDMTDIDFGQYEDPDAQMEYLICNGYIVNDWFLRINPDNVTMLPQSMLTVAEGRMPEKDGELVINMKYAHLWGNPEIGDTVELTLITCGSSSGEVLSAGADMSAVPEKISEAFAVKDIETLAYTVVGYSDEYNIVHYSDTGLRSYTSGHDNLIARFADSTNDLYWDMHHAFQDRGMEIDDYDYSLNQELLNAEGKGVTAKYYRAVFMMLVYLVVLFIMFCVRMVIDNSFEISSKERIKQFGLLKAVGASSKQIFLIVVMEALLLSAGGVPAGLLAGWGASAAIFEAVKKISALDSISAAYALSDMLVFSAPAYIFISSALIGVFWVIISAVGTGMRVIKASPVDAMRMGARKERFKPSKIRPAVGTGNKFITAYATLNLKRNKKRYIITLVSMTISMVMFSGFSYVLEMADKYLLEEYEYNRQPYQFTVTLNSFSTDAVKEYEDMLAESGLFSEMQTDCSIGIVVSSSSGISSDSKSYNTNGMMLYIHPVNEATYNSYIASSSGISYGELESSRGILLCRDAVADTESRDKYDVFTSSVPSSLTGNPFLSADFDILDAVTVSVTGTYTTDNSMYQTIGRSICAVISESAYADLMAECGGKDNNTYTLNMGDGESYNVYVRDIALNAAEGKETEALNFLKKHLYNMYTDNYNSENSSLALLTAIKIGGYFIIGVLTLIAVINIVNIISTNVLNRTAELGTMRACGLSDKQLMSLVRCESLFYAIMSAVISLMVMEAVIAAVQIPFKLGKYITEEDLTISLSYTAPLKYILISAAAAFIVAAAASILPAKRIINTPIVETINNIE